MAAFFVVALGASSAWASTQTYTITQGNAALAGFTGPFADVVISMTDGTNLATVTVTGRTVGGFVYKLGGQGIAGVNVSTKGPATSGGFSGTQSDGGVNNED